MTDKTLLNAAMDVTAHSAAWTRLLREHVASLPEDIPPGPECDGVFDKTFAQHELAAMERDLPALKAAIAASRHVDVQEATPSDLPPGLVLVATPYRDNDPWMLIEMTGPARARVITGGCIETEAIGVEHAHRFRGTTPSATPTSSPADDPAFLRKEMTGLQNLLKEIYDAPTMEAGYCILRDWARQFWPADPVALQSDAPETDGLTETAGAGHWTASVTDNWPSTRGPNARARVLHVHGTFPSEEAALTAAEAAIASGWVADNALHRETAKAHADFNLPQQEINRIGRLSAARAVASTPEWKDRHPNLTTFMGRLWRGAKSMDLSAEDDFRELYDAALDGKLEASHLARLAVDEVRNSTDDPIVGLTVLFTALLADAAPAPTAQQADPLGKVRQAIADYHYALDTRQNGSVAENRALHVIEEALDVRWVPDAEKARRSSASTPAAPVAVVPSEPVPVRCGSCGWLGDATELGPEGECGADESCSGRPAEITSPADMMKAWQDSEGQICGKALADAGLIEPKPATPEEVGRLELEPGDTVWAISDAGYAVLRAGNGEHAPTAAEEA